MRVSRRALCVSFMRFRCRVAFPVAKGFRLLMLDQIRTCGVKGPIATMADGGAGCREECFGLFEELHRLALRGGRFALLRGQTVDLINAEDGVGFQERNCLFHGFARVVGIGAGEAVGVDDQGTVFALANLRAKLVALR